MEKSKRLHKSEKLLRLRYVTQNKSPEEIAKEFGVTPKTIYRALSEFKLLRK